MSEVILVRAVQTCVSHPSQWDAWDLDGRYWYVRYRSGIGSMARHYERDTAPFWFDDEDTWSSEIELGELLRRFNVTWAPSLADRVTEWEAPPCGPWQSS